MPAHVILFMLLLCYSFQDVAGQIPLPHFEITRVEKCGADEGPLQLNYVNVTKKNGNQYANFDGVTEIPLGDNVGVASKIEYAADGKLFVPLLTVRDKNTCKAANQYLNEFWYDIERAANIAVGVCPLAAGHYRAQNILLDFKKIVVQTVPFGVIKSHQPA